MSKTLLILAHPNASSLSHALAKSIATFLHTNGCEIDVIDLYEEKFDANLTPCERAAYFSHKPYIEEVSQQADQLTDAQTLILVFPTWWFGVPAILKGWIDRVFAPTIAFDHANAGTKITPRLRKIKSVIIVTTLGAPWWVDYFVMRRPLRRILKRAVFGLCAPQAKFKMFSLYRSNDSNTARLNQFTKKITNYLSR